MITILHNAKECSCMRVFILRYIEAKNLRETCIYVQLQTTFRIAHCSEKSSEKLICGSSASVFIHDSLKIP